MIKHGLAMTGLYIINMYMLPVAVKQKNFGYVRKVVKSVLITVESVRSTQLCTKGCIHVHIAILCNVHTEVER